MSGQSAHRSAGLLRESSFVDVDFEQSIRRRRSTRGLQPATTHTPIMSQPSLTNFIVKRPWLKRWMTPLANWYTDASGYRKLGLRYDRPKEPATPTAPAAATIAAIAAIERANAIQHNPLT